MSLLSAISRFFAEDPEAGARRQNSRQRNERHERKGRAPHFAPDAAVPIAKAGISKEQVLSIWRSGRREGMVEGRRRGYPQRYRVRLRYKKQTHSIVYIEVRPT
jgi:hypothetical protein